MGASEDSAVWSSRRHDPENTAFNSGSAPETNQTLWTGSFGPKSEGAGGGYVPSVAIGYGKLFLGDRSGVLRAIDEFTGDTAWNLPLDSGDIFGPALGYEKIYVVTDYGALFAVNESQGDVVWSTKIVASPSINIADGRLFVCAFNGTFYCLNATSGSILWTRDLAVSDTETYIISHPAVADNRVFLGTVCLNESDGSTIWNVTLNGQNTLGPRNFPVVSNDRVFIGVQGTLFGLDVGTGSVIWNFTTGGELYRAPPAVAYGKIFVPSTNNIFYCLDAQDGSLIWQKENVGGIISIPYGSTSAGVAVADGKIFLAHPDWAIICLNASSGDIIWEYLTAGPPAPPLVADGLVLATLVHDPQIYIFGAQPGPSPTSTVFLTPLPSIPEFPFMVVLLSLALAVLVVVAIESKIRKIPTRT
jgi:outer membrane protein assembly factor BamB